MSDSNFNHIFEHFAQFNRYITRQHDSISRQQALSSQLVNEQQQIIRMLIVRSEECFTKLALLVNRLCDVLTHYDEEEEISQANRQLEAEVADWNQLQKQINLRKQLLNLKVAKRQRLKNPTKNKSQSYSVTPKGRRDYSLNCPSVKQEGPVQDYRMKLREQFYTIKQFIVQHLSQMIEYREGSQIPKKIVLNIYMRWNRLKGRACLIDETGKIQMELTNQLKNKFPRIHLTRQVFKGVQFKVGFTEQMELTDRAPPFREEDVSFNGDDYFDPIDDLLREADENGSQKEEIGTVLGRGRK